MWYRLLVPCLVLVLTLGPLGCVRSQRSGFRWSRTGKSAYRAISPDTLSEHIRTTIKVSTENSSATDQSLVRLHEKDPELGELARSAKANPQDLAARWRLAEAYISQELYYPAFQLYQEIKSQAPRDPKVELAIARIWTVWGDYSLARRRAECALELDPDSVEGLGLLGRIHLRRNDPAQAKAAFRKALVGKPKNSSLLAWLGQAQQMLGNQVEARKSLELALQFNPTLALARRLLGRAPASPAETESVARTRSEPSRQATGVAKVKGNDPPEPRRTKPAVTTGAISWPSQAIQKPIVPEPADPLGPSPSLPEFPLPYTLPPALKRFLQESTPNPLENGRSVLIDTHASSADWFIDEVEVATDSRNAILIPVVLVDLEAALASGPGRSIGSVAAALPNLPINPAYFLEEPKEPADPLEGSRPFDRFTQLGLNRLIDFPRDILGLEQNATRTAALFSPSGIVPGEGDIWNLALMFLLLSCAAVPVGRRRGTLPRPQQSRKRTSLAAAEPTSRENSSLAVLPNTQETWDSAGPGCLFPVAEVPLLVGGQAAPAVAHCETRFEEGTHPGIILRNIPQRTNVESEELGRVVKLAVGALVLTQLAVPLIRRYQSQPRAYPGTRAAW